MTYLFKSTPVSVAAKKANGALDVSGNVLEIEF
jgi:hypothetical protein